MNYSSFYMNSILCISFFYYVFLLFSSFGNFIRSFVYVMVYCVGAGITTLMSLSDGLGLYFFCRKIEKTRPTKEEMDGKVFTSRLSLYMFGNFPFIDKMIKVLLLLCTLIWRVSNYISRQAKGL